MRENGRSTRFIRLIACWGILVAGLPGCGKATGETAAALVLEAQNARAKGEPRQAKALLDRAIELYPASFCYLERARLEAELGNIDAAMADCNKGLNADPDNPEIKDLLAECRKPVKERFLHGKGVTAREDR